MRGKTALFLRGWLVAISIALLFSSLYLGGLEVSHTCHFEGKVTGSSKDHQLFSSSVRAGHLHEACFLSGICSVAAQNAPAVDFLAAAKHLTAVGMLFRPGFLDPCFYLRAPPRSDV
ncbi:MAG: hypothetical protein HY645_03865 [Acidobacteria bacterium]|nr:hypothetical protein [Acidobacteriota bacterium]